MRSEAKQPQSTTCTGNQFAELPQPDGWDPGVPWPKPTENYYDVQFLDGSNNVIADGQYNVLPENATPGQGAYGSPMFADSDSVRGLQGVNNFTPEDAIRALPRSGSIPRGQTGAGRADHEKRNPLPDR